jgi:sulfofructose kinase
MSETVDVVGVGLNAMDTICVLERFPERNTKVGIREVRTEPGGQVATALATCARFGLSTRYIGCVGDDELGRAQLQSLRDAGLATDLVQVIRGAATQMAVILLEKDVGERTVLWHHDPLLVYPENALRRDMIASARILHLDGCDTTAALQAARWAREAGIPVVIDIDELYDQSTEQLLRHVDYLIAAEDFAARTVPDAPPEDAVKVLADRYGCPVVGITLGRRGAVFLERGRLIQAPGFEVRVMDTTGAGDVFHGAFLYGVLQGWTVTETATFANAAAALKCTQFGARRGIPQLDQVLSLLR